MIEHPLDLDAVQAFVHIAELGSFTRAARAMGTTQSTVSLKLKRLEERLGCRLFERTPRYVELSVEGATFLGHARELLQVQERAISAFDERQQRLSIAISDHVAGPELPALIARMNAQDPKLVMEIRIGSSRDLLQGYDRREFDAVIVRQHFGRDDGEILAQERLGWFAAPEWRPLAGAPLPVATMPETCGVRTIATQALEKAGRPWVEAFVGGGVSTVSAAVMAGLGIAALARRMLPMGAVEVGERLGLPELPVLPVILHSRLAEGRPKEALEALSVAFRNAAQG